MFINTRAGNRKIEIHSRKMSKHQQKKHIIEIGQTKKKTNPRIRIFLNLTKRLLLERACIAKVGLMYN